MLVVRNGRCQRGTACSLAEAAGQAAGLGLQHIPSSATVSPMQGSPSRPVLVGVQLVAPSKPSCLCSQC